MPPTIGWDESLPSDSESAGLGDDRIRSLKTSLRIGLDGEHVWPSGGGDVGVHRLGSARPYYGAQSLVSSTGTDGRLMVTSDTSRLFHVGSGGTMFLGGATALSAGSQPVGGSRFYWATEFGSDSFQVGQGSRAVVFPNSGFSGAPFVFVTCSGGSFAIGVSGANTTNLGFTAVYTPVQGSLVGFNWLSIGTRTL
jgi:hypothetical protein